MLIDCPHCSKSYHIARATLGEGGRMMRCAACRQVWHAEARTAPAGQWDSLNTRTPGEPESEAAPGPEISAIATSARAAAPTYDELYGTPRPAPSAAPRVRKRLPRLPGGLVAFALVLGGATAALAQRQNLVRAVPAFAPVYAAIGLPVNLRGLEIRHVTSGIVGEGTQRVLAIEGEITNISHGQMPVPLLDLAVRGAQGRKIYGWTASAPKATLAAGETIQFRARLASPPEMANDVAVRFAPVDEKTREARK